MTFDPDEALKKARASVHGFHFDGPSDAERRVEHLERVVSALFRQERKLKLERLMWKSSAMANAYSMRYNTERSTRWGSLMRACKKELENMK